MDSHPMGRSCWRSSTSGRESCRRSASRASTVRPMRAHPISCRTTTEGMPSARRFLLPVLATLGAAAGSSAVGAVAPRLVQGAAANAPEPMEELVVEGRHEGPRMWTVRSGDHTLWILGTISPLPKKMVWQPDAVEEALKYTQEVVPAWPSYGIGANPITALRVYIAWRHVQNPPDNLPLRESLPPPLYARVEALRIRYAPHDNKIEKMRPMLAARELLTHVLDAAGLALHNEVQQEVLALAARHGVRVHQDKLRIDDPVNVLKDVTAPPASRRYRPRSAYAPSSRARRMTGWSP